jgi:hypothetical protein
LLPVSALAGASFCRLGMMKPFFQENDCRGFAESVVAGAALKKTFWPKMFPETTH